MSGRPREEQVEGPRNHRYHPRVDQYEVVVVRVREHDHLELAGVLDILERRCGMPQFLDLCEAGQGLVVLGGVAVGVDETRRSCVELYNASL